MGTFPFGWLRGIEKDNWQILWDSHTKALYAKGVNSKRVIQIGKSSTWFDAKAFADRVQKEPEVYLNSFQLGGS